VPLVRAALTGIPPDIDPRGVVDAALPRDAPGVLAHTVALADGATAYRAIGQLFAPLALGVCLLALGDAFVRRRARSSAPPPEELGT
jgi:apolipoprotein N-acyltransferase